MPLLNIIPFVHACLKEVIKIGDVVVDATMGNGHDTAFLASLVGHNGQVWAFDVQPAALSTTYQRLHQQQLAQQVRLIHAGHEQLSQYVPAAIQAAIFNCGYLPGADKQLTTTATSTLLALQAALSRLMVGGRIGLVMYPGHTAGKIEAKTILQWTSQLPQQQVAVLRYGFTNRLHAAPFALVLEKLIDFPSVVSNELIEREI